LREKSLTRFLESVTKRRVFIRGQANREENSGGEEPREKGKKKPSGEGRVKGKNKNTLSDSGGN